ncbi:MAG TPA: hypothetical protein VNX25_08345 [Verrucomicrobiae bacterium]|nr:hypothetical protein [Verrucomicrobiae bacterium]
MRPRSRFQSMAPLIEFLAGTGLGIFFHYVLHDPQVSYILFGTGALLSLVTYIMREDIHHAQEALAEEYRKSHEIALALSRVHDPECQEKGQNLLAGLMKNFALLQQGYIPLDETELLLEAAKAMDQSRSHVRAVNPLMPGWATRSALIRYYDSNRRAARRGVDISRVFVIQREQLEDSSVQKLILSHIKDGIDVRVVFREELPSGGETTWIRECSFNFVVFDDRLVLDVFKYPGTYFGMKTHHPSEVAKYMRLFEMIDHNSHQAVIAEDGVTVVP